MPIKFKCSCGKVLSVPEKMAGKKGKCPECQKPLKVPTPSSKKSPEASGKPGASGKASQTKKAGSRVAAASAPAASGLDSLFDEVGLAQQQGPVCSNCGGDIKPNARVCTNCGYNFETGETLKGVQIKAAEQEEFSNMYLSEAAKNMKRELQSDERREKAAMPWWVLMSFLIGAMTLCAAGVVIVDGKFNEPQSASTFLGRVQRLPVVTTFGLTIEITGISIVLFAHLSITFFGFMQSWKKGLGAFCLPPISSIVVGIMHWADNKSAVKAIIMALVMIGVGIFMIMQGGGFEPVRSLF